MINKTDMTNNCSQLEGKQLSQMPRHVAVIMDGNGRWAQKRNLPRVAGHKKGIDAARDIVKNCNDIGIPYLTLFGFSTENWKRPKDEVLELMKFLKYYLKTEVNDLDKQNIRLRVLGFRHRLESSIVDLIEKAEEKTKNNTGLQLSIALDYGGQQDIVHAVRSIVASGIDVDEIDEEVMRQHLMSQDIPDPDLIIRTSGEYRVSNFLLWQSAYSEFYFTDVFWPDFDRKELEKALQSFAKRDRRLGDVVGTISDVA